MQGVRNGAGSEVMQRSGEVIFCTLKCNLPLMFSCTGTGVIKRPKRFLYVSSSSKCVCPEEERLQFGGDPLQCGICQCRRTP